MVVTKLSEISKTRSKVYLDEEFAFVLYKGELRVHRIREGQELSEDSYREILETVLPKRAKMRCLNLLKNREYTQKQLRDKLKQGFYPEACIEEAIAYAASFHYVDDSRYASQYISCQLKSKSRRRIEYDLLQKGISKQEIKEAFERLEEEETLPDEAVLIRRLMNKKHYEVAQATQQEKARLCAFLYRRGFSQAKIQEALREEGTDNGTEDEFYLT